MTRGLCARPAPIPRRRRFATRTPSSTTGSSRLGWRDRTDDGRYTIVGDSPAVAHGTDAARMINMINTEIAAVVSAIKDERTD